MKIDFYKVLKFSIIYVLFVLGISILSEWVNTKLKNSKGCRNNNQGIDQKLDQVLDSLKQELKDQYLQKFQEIQAEEEYLGNNENIEYFSNYDQIMSEDEKQIMGDLESRIKKGEYFENNLVAFGQKPVNQTVRDIMTTHNLYKNYEKVPREIKLQELPTINIPNKDFYVVGDRYKFIPTVKSSNQIVKGHQGKPPSMYTFKDKPELRHAFYNDKYSPENYKVEPMDDKSMLFSSV